MLPNGNEMIQKLKENGDTICFVTARLMDIKDCDTELIMRKSLLNLNIQYDGLY